MERSGGWEKGEGKGKEEAGTVVVSCDTDKCNKPNLTICMSGQRGSISDDFKLSLLPRGGRNNISGRIDGRLRRRGKKSTTKCKGEVRKSRTME